MVPGFRYHVVTLVAIFMALTIGIIFGSTFIGNAAVEYNTKRLEALSKMLHDKVQVLELESKHHAEFYSALIPLLLKDALIGKQVALVQTGDYPDTVRRIEETVKSAGGTVASVTTVDRGFPTRAQTNLNNILPTLLFAHPNLPKDSSALLNVIAIVLARGGAQELQPLEDARLIRTEGDYSRPNDYVIVVGGASPDNDSRAETLDVPLVKFLRDEKVTVVEAEPENAAISYIPALKGLDISTVDNADTDPGRIALVLALRGEKGHYGVKPTRTSILPSPLPTNDISRRTGP